MQKYIIMFDNGAYFYGFNTVLVDTEFRKITTMTGYAKSAMKFEGKEVAQIVANAVVGTPILYL